MRGRCWTKLSRMDRDDTALDEWEVLDLLTSLVDKSLVVYEEDEQGVGRYRLLETVRQYAHERLLIDDNSAIVRGRHLDYFLGWAEGAGSQLVGPEQKWWCDRLETEHDNLRAALDWCLSDSAAGDTSLRATYALAFYWWVRSHATEGYSYLRAALAQDMAARPTAARARTLCAAAVLAHVFGDLDAVHALQDEALAIAQVVGDEESIASSYNRLGAAAFHECDFDTACVFLERAMRMDLSLDRYAEASGSMAVLAGVAIRRGDFAAAKDRADEALRLARMGGQTHNEAFAEILRGHAALYLQDYGAAQAGFEQALKLVLASGAQVWESWALEGLGRVALLLDDMSSARAHLERGVNVCRAGHQPGMEGRCLLALAYVAYHEHDYNQAGSRTREAIKLLQPTRMKWEIVCALEATAAVMVQLERLTSAARLYSAATAQRSRMGSPVALAPWTDGADNMALAQQALGGAGFSAAWQAGQHMTLEQAVEYALSESEAA